MCLCHIYACPAPKLVLLFRCMSSVGQDLNTLHRDTSCAVSCFFGHSLELGHSKDYVYWSLTSGYKGYNGFHGYQFQRMTLIERMQRLVFLSSTVQVMLQAGGLFEDNCNLASA